MHGHKWENNRLFKQYAKIFVNLAVSHKEIAGEKAELSILLAGCPSLASSSSSTDPWTRKCVFLNYDSYVAPVCLGLVPKLSDLNSHLWVYTICPL